MDNIAKDILFAFRMLGRNPGFTAVAVATLALGIGANTAIFSVVNGVLLKPLPFRDPERLAMVWQKSASVPQLGISELDLDDYRVRTQVFEGLGGFTAPASRSTILTGAGSPIELLPSYITQNYFSILGTAPVVGRDFSPEEGRRGSNQVAILSYSLWQSRFGGTRDVVQRQITLNKQKLQVIGVMGPDVYPPDADVFVPFTRASPDKPMPRNYHELNVVGRLRPGRTLAEAQRETDALSAELEQAYPATNRGIGAAVSPLREEITGKVRDPILMLMMAVGLVLLIACSNVANLLLVRAAARQKELAIRVAIGASRGRIVMQFMIECLLLSAAGALLGLLLAFGLMPVIRTLGAVRIPLLQHIGIDLQVLLFTAAISILTGVIFGLIPALRSSSSNLNQTLRYGGRTSSSDSGGVRSVLVAGEVAIALVVLVAASLLVRSLNKLFEVQPGFRADHLLIAHLALPSNQYRQADVQRFYARLLPRIAAIPGVVAASATSALPVASAITPTRFSVQGAPMPQPGNYPVAAIVSVDRDFFSTMGIPLVRGRTFQPEEVGNANADTCLINATLARTFFGAADPIGRSVVGASSPEAYRIIGVVGDTRVAGIDSAPLPVIYFGAFKARGILVVRTSTEPMAIATSIQREVAANDSEQPLSGLQTMEEVLSQSLSRRSFAAVLLVMFSAFGLILAALGLYGLMSYSVAQRTQEIGVRMALGASPESIYRLVLLRGLWITSIGLLAGVIAAAGATRAMSSLLFGIGPADPLSFGIGCGLLLTVSAVACLVPAVRATRVDPIVALRYDG